MFDPVTILQIPIFDQVAPFSDSRHPSDSNGFWFDFLRPIAEELTLAEAKSVLPGNLCLGFRAFFGESGFQTDILNNGRRRPNFFLNWSFRRARNDSGVELAICFRFDPENSKFKEIRRKLFPRPVRKVGQLWAAVTFEPEEISPREFHHSMRHDLS